MYVHVIQALLAQALRGGQGLVLRVLKPRQPKQVLERIDACIALPGTPAEQFANDVFVTDDEPLFP